MVAAQETVTAEPVALAVGVAPWLTLVAAAAPLPPGVEPGGPVRPGGGRDERQGDRDGEGRQVALHGATAR